MMIIRNCTLCTNGPRDPGDCVISNTTMESLLSAGVTVEEITSPALVQYQDSQHGHQEGFVRFRPSGQVCVMSGTVFICETV